MGAEAMSDKPIVPIEPILHAIAVIAEFNRLNLAEVTLHQNGEPIPGVTPEVVRRFRVTGLANKDFLVAEFWNGGEPMEDSAPTMESRP